MRVVLKQEVRGLGRPGDVKEVADGYAQNFLLPKGLAIEASAGELKREHKINVDPRKIQAEPLRALGVHKVEVRLLTDVRAHVAVAIEPA